MGPQAEDYIETVLTCEGDYYDPAFHTKLQMFSRKLEELILQDKKKKKLILKKVEPWNSVKVTFNIPKEAALRLKCLAEQGDSTLKELGILAVEIEGDRKISLKIAGKNNETTELVFRTNPSGASTIDIAKVEDVPAGGSSRKDILDYLGHHHADSSSSDVAAGSSNHVHHHPPHLQQQQQQSQGPYFVSTTPQVSPKFPTPPPSVSTPSSPSAKAAQQQQHHLGAGLGAPTSTPHLLSPTSQATMETMVKLLSNKTSGTSPLLVDLLQNDLVAAGAHSAVFSRALNNVLPQTFNSVVPQPSTRAAPPPTAFPPDEGISMQPPVKKKRKVRKPKERDNSKLKKDKREQETKHAIQNILNQAVSGGVQQPQDRVPPILTDQLTSDATGGRAGTPAKSPVPKSPIHPSLAPGQRHIINPFTGQLELVDDDLNATPPKAVDSSLHEANKGHLVSPIGRNIVPSYSRSPGSGGQYGKQSSVVYDRVVPKSPRSSPPRVSVKNALRDPNTLVTHCDQLSSNIDMTRVSHATGETSFMQPTTCLASSALQSSNTQPRPSLPGHIPFPHPSGADVSTAMSMSQTISAILSNVSKSGGLALATLNPPDHEPSQNAGTTMQNPSGLAVSTAPFNVHGSSLLLNSTSAVSNISPSDFIPFPHKDSSAEVETIRQSQIPSVLMEADSSGDSNASVTHQSGLTSESQPPSFGIHGISQSSLHASHIDKTGSSISQGQGAIHVNSVEGPKVNSVHVNSSVVNSPLQQQPPTVSVSSSSPSIQPLKNITKDAPPPTIAIQAPPITSKPNGTTRFLHQEQQKGELLNHDSELSSHSSDDHVKQGSIDSGLGLGDMKVNNGESPSGSSGNDSPGIASSSGNRDSDSEKDRDFNLPEKQNVITIGYVLSKEDEHPPSKRDLLDHLEKYSQNNMDGLKKQHPLSSVIEPEGKNSSNSLMKLPTLIKLPHSPYSKSEKEIVSDKSRVNNSLDGLNHCPREETTPEKAFKSERAMSEGEVTFADDRSSMVQVCSNGSEVLTLCNSEDTVESIEGKRGEAQATSLKLDPPAIPTSEHNPPPAGGTGQSNTDSLKSPDQDMTSTGSTEASNGSMHQNNPTASPEPQVSTCNFMDISKNTDTNSPKSCEDGSVETVLDKNHASEADCVSESKGRAVSVPGITQHHEEIQESPEISENNSIDKSDNHTEVKGQVHSTPVLERENIQAAVSVESKTPVQIGGLSESLSQTSSQVTHSHGNLGTTQQAESTQPAPSVESSVSQSVENTASRQTKSPLQTTVISSCGNTQHEASVQATTTLDSITLSVSTESVISNQLQLSPRGETATKPVLVPVNSYNNNITLSALDKHLIQPASSAPVFNQIGHQTPLLSVHHPAPFKGPGNFTPTIQGGFLTAVTSSGQSNNTELLLPTCSMLQLPIQPVILHAPLAKNYVVNSATEKVCVTESSTTLNKHLVSTSAKSPSLSPGITLENPDTKHLLSTVATTVSYTQASMSSSSGLGILPITSLATAKSDVLVNLCLPSVMTPSLANIPLFSKCTSTAASLKPGHRSMASLAPSPIMSTGLPYLGTTVSTVPRALTPPADAATDAKLPKGVIPKGISIMKPLRDRESNMDEDLLESPIKDKKLHSPRKNERTEKAVFHKRGNFTVAQLLDEAEKAKQSQALLKPCITSDNNENLSKTFTSVINTTCVSVKNAHIPKTVNSNIDNLISGSSGKNMPGTLQTNISKTEDTSVVLKTCANSVHSTKPVLVNSQSTKTVLSHHNMTHSSLEHHHINSIDTAQEAVSSSSDTSVSISPLLVSSATSDTALVTQTSPRDCKNSENQPKDTVLSSKNTAVKSNESNDFLVISPVKIVTKNSFKGEFLKLGTGSTSDCFNVKIEPAHSVIKEKSSPSKEQSATQVSPVVREAEQTESKQVSSPSPSATVENSPGEALPSSTSLEHEHSYSVSPHKSASAASREQTSPNTNARGNHTSDISDNLKNITLPELVSVKPPQNFSVTKSELELGIKQLTESATSSKVNAVPDVVVSEEIVQDFEQEDDQGPQISKPTITSLNADIGKTLLYVGSSDSKEPTNFTFDLRSAVTHPAAYPKFIKLEPGNDWVPKSTNKLTSNITVKVTNDVGKVDVASTSTTNLSYESGAEHVKSIDLKRRRDKDDHLVNDIVVDGFLAKGQSEKSERTTLPSRRKSTTESSRSTVGLEDGLKHLKPLLIRDGSLEAGEEMVRPGKVTRRSSRGSADSKASSTDGTWRSDEAAPVRVSLRGRNKRASENSESGTIGVEQPMLSSSSRSGSLERSVSPHPTSKPAIRSSRRKDKSNLPQEPHPVTEQTDSLQSRSTRSSKRKHPVTDEDVDQVKKVKVENCSADMVVDMNEAEGAEAGDRRMQTKGRVVSNKNKASPLDIEAEDPEKLEEKESGSYKRSTRSAHSVEHCELPNNYTTKKKQKSH